MPNGGYPKDGLGLQVPANVKKRPSHQFAIHDPIFFTFLGELGALAVKLSSKIRRCGPHRPTGCKNHPVCLGNSSSAVTHVSREPKTALDGVLLLQHIVGMKTAAVHSRIQPEIKEKAEGILQRLGLSPTEAIRMFYTQIALRNGLPFDVAIPNDQTIKALEDSRSGRNLERFDSTEKLFESWDA